jgi:ribulose-phosphate 3-epimerase
VTKILPALLSHKITDLESQIKAAEPYFSEAQVDFMDGVFVPTKSVTAKEVRGIKTSLKLEAHLMVQDPVLWITSLVATHFRRIIVHQEIGSSFVEALRLIRSLGLEVGLAVNPDTDLEGAIDWWKELNLIQVMGVYPGQYGAPFQPIALEKIRFIRERGFAGVIQVDGGVTPDTAANLRRAGANSLVVGHYFFGSEQSPTLDKIGEKLASLRAALATTS